MSSFVNEDAPVKVNIMSKEYITEIIEYRENKRENEMSFYFNLSQTFSCTNIIHSLFLYLDIEVKHDEKKFFVRRGNLCL